MKNDLTSEYVKTLLRYDPDTGEFTWTKRKSQMTPGKKAGSLLASGYVHIRIDKRHYLAHRLAWLICKGSWPDGHIDHINRIRDDNRIANLRDIDPKKNVQNRSSYRSNKHGYVGVTQGTRQKSFTASIRVGGRLIQSSGHPTAEAAHNAYTMLKAKHHITTQEKT